MKKTIAGTLMSYTPLGQFHLVNAVTLRLSKSEERNVRYKIMVRVPHHDIVFLN